MKNLSRRSFFQNLGIGAGAISLITSQSSFTNVDKKLNIVICGLGRYAGYLAEIFKDTQYCHLAGISRVILDNQKFLHISQVKKV